MLTAALCLHCFPLDALASSHKFKDCILIGDLNCECECVCVCGRLPLCQPCDHQLVCGVPCLSPDDSWDRVQLPTGPL